MLDSSDRISAPTSPAVAGRKSGYIPTLDGWRALAILAVLFNHDRTWLSASWVHNCGRQGVDLFFALSGILITTRLLAEEKTLGSINLRNFYIRRLCRIQPAALTYLACISLLMLFGLLNQAFRGVAFAAVLVRNYFPLHSGVDDWYTGHFWSLSVEEHFYLFFPFLLIGLKKYRVSVLVALACALELWQIFLNRHPSLQFGWSPSSHTDVAATGILLAASVALLLVRPRVRAWCQSWLHPYTAFGLAALVWLGSVQKLPHLDGLFSLAVLCTYPLLVVSTLLHPHTLIGKALETAPLRFIGRLSYSIYLWQMLFFCTVYAIPAPHSLLLLHAQSSWMRYPATLVLSIVSYYAIEKPMVTLGHRWTSSRLPTRDATTDSTPPATERATEPSIAAS